MTKGQMLANINIMIKWATENSAETLEKIQIKMLGYNFKFRGYGYHQNKRMFRLSKDELMNLMIEITECAY